MREEVWLVYYNDPKYFEPDLHIVCQSSETAQKYIEDTMKNEPLFEQKYFKVEKHQVY
jgi:hypothetical protein